MFLTLPAVFQQMPMGQLFAVFFFLSVFFAGITSLINMFEAVVESWQSHFNLNRKLAVLLCSAITLGVGLFLEAEPNVGPVDGLYHHRRGPHRRSDGRGVRLLCAGLAQAAAGASAGPEKAHQCRLRQQWAAMSMCP